jgi:hypothetical protein
MPAEKAPRPNSFTGVFYRSCWEIIKNEVMAAFHYFYNQTAGPLPKLNGALLTLIPKSEVAELPGEFRPISLIHSFAKLLSKVLAIRLAPYRNLVRVYHTKKTPSLLVYHTKKTLMKLDISKDFDSVSWEYFVELLHRVFLMKWCNWPCLLFSTPSSSVRLNGIRGP